jgi:hypothetical protein
MISMFDVYDPLEECEEGQEYEISDGITESFTTDIELEDIAGAQPSWLRAQGVPRLTADELKELLLDSQSVKISPIDGADVE